LIVTKFFSTVTDVVDGAVGSVVVVVAIDVLVEAGAVDEEAGAAFGSVPEPEHAAPNAIDVATSATSALLRLVSGCSHA
jgi:hypothetical protein